MKAQAAAGNDGSTTTVLIVDDEHNSLKYFARLFGSDFEVLTCTSAEEALAIFEARNGAVAVIVSDHRMPVTTGVTLLTRVKERWPDTVRLLTTAYADTESLAASINDASVHRYISKPWDLDHLRDVLDDASKAYARNATAGQPGGRAAAGGGTDSPPLLGVVAHELATPLLSIEMTSRSIQNAVQDQVDNSPPEKQAETAATLSRFVRAAQRIGEDAARARRLARALADLARDSTARSAFMRVSARDCVQRSVDVFPYQGNERTWVHVDPTGDFKFLGTDVLMMAVLTNVLSNALDAARPQPNPSVAISLQGGKAYNSVFVRDSGLGVSPLVDGQIFRPFVSAKKNGIGLGLSICDWIVRSFGGAIEFSGGGGQLTQVEIRLPPATPQMTS